MALGSRKVGVKSHSEHQVEILANLVHYTAGFSAMLLVRNHTSDTLEFAAATSKGGPCTPCGHLAINRAEHGVAS